jgi:hypothetical protein
METDATKSQIQERQADESDDEQGEQRETLTLLIEATAIEMFLDLMTIAARLHGVPPATPVTPRQERLIEA